MWNLLRYFYRHHVVLIFVALEVFSLVLVFSRNDFQRSIFMTSSNRVSGNVYEYYSGVMNYFSLTSSNRQLAGENARLRLILYGLTPDTTINILYPEPLEINSSSPYTFQAARVINNSVARQYNYLTLDKGRRDGIRADMGVIAAGGAVGVVAFVSESYATVISLLNPRWNISARLQRSNYFGSLSWDGSDYRYARLTEIPFHVELMAGDTITTSGFSTIFPEGVMLGFVEEFSREGGDNFYSIKVRLSVDFKSLVWVDVVDNKDRDEIKFIESLSNNGTNLD